MTVFNYLVGAAIAGILFWGNSDRSWSAAVHWSLFYFVGIAVPFRWARRTHRMLSNLDVPVSKELRTAVYYPVMIGVLTVLIGISLIREARLR